MKNLILFFLLFSMCLSEVIAQTDPADQLVSFNYRNIRLEDALTDVSEQYEVNFAYSKNYIPVDQKISVNVEGVPFTRGLDSLLAEVQVGYQLVGSQVVLKFDRTKPVKRRSRSIGFLRRKKQRPTTPPKPVQPNHEVEGDDFYPEWDSSSEGYTTITESSAPESDAHQELQEIEFALEQESIVAAQDKGKLAVNRRPSKREIEQQPVAWSILPYIGSHMHRSDEFVNRWSFNLIWGYNGGVNGLEIGLLGNSVERNVTGMQLAGIGNTVGGNIDAGQFGGIFNYVNGTTKGIQVAGIVNSTKRLTGFQAGGITNVVYEYAKGIQFGGVGNVVLGVSDALQVGGVFNANTGRSALQVAGVLNYAPSVSLGQVAGFNNVADQVDGIQLAGGINVAEYVNGVQAAGLINIAGKVDGVQIGLINICDTINGMPIGLLNIIKHGYNRFELSGSEALYLNAALKLGGHRFYNILQTGFRYDDGGINPNAGRTEVVSWALGYGLGMVIPLSQLWHLNLEAVSMHVNEGERWTSTLNLLNQFRVTADVDWNGASFFVGPTFNLMSSKLFDADTQTYGSAIAPYSFYDRTSSGNNPVNTKMWVGFHAGFRW